MGISESIRTSLTGASLIRKVADEGLLMKQDGKGPVFDLSLGNPTLDPPPAFLESLQAIVNDGESGMHRYMSNNGYPHVREAVATQLTKEYGLPFTTDLISMSVGAAGGINTALKTLLDPGDEVICFTPYFVEYDFYVSNHGGKALFVDTKEDFQIDLDAVAKALSPKTKVILLNTPNNPTGVVYSAGSLESLAGLLREHNKNNQTVYIINDSPYRRLIYDLAQAPEPFSFYEHSILATSFSKDLGIPGERIGYVAFSPRCEEAAMMAPAMAFSSRVLGFVNAPALMQRALPALLECTIDMDWYRRKRDRLIESLKGFGYEMTIPQGAFYLFPKAPGGDDVKLFGALKEKRVLVVPGSGFGKPGYFRIAYCTSDEIIEQALPAFREALVACS